MQDHECDDRSDDQGHDKTLRRISHMGDETGFVCGGLRVYFHQFHAKTDPLNTVSAGIGFPEGKNAGILYHTRENAPSTGASGLHRMGGDESRFFL